MFRWVELGGKRVLAECRDGRYQLREDWGKYDAERLRKNPALAALRRNVTGRVESGEAEPITEVPPARNDNIRQQLHHHSPEGRALLEKHDALTQPGPGDPDEHTAAKEYKAAADALRAKPGGHELLRRFDPAAIKDPKKPGQFTAGELIANYRKMHGKAPSASQLKKLRGRLAEEALGYPRPGMEGLGGKRVLAESDGRFLQEDLRVAALTEGLHLRVHFKDGRTHKRRVHGGDRVMAARIARQLRKHPGVEKVELHESWDEFDAARKAGKFSKNVKAGPMPGHVIDSPGRGPTGELRNFHAMGTAKLKETLEALALHGEDPEAHKAAMQVAAEKLGVFQGGKVKIPHEHVGNNVAGGQLVLG